VGLLMLKHKTVCALPCAKNSSLSVTVYFIRTTERVDCWTPSWKFPVPHRIVPLRLRSWVIFRSFVNGIYGRLFTVLFIFYQGSFLQNIRLHSF
jgi:hypothetical protein